MFKAAFFDLDGTLVNSLYDLAASTNHVIAKYGFNKREVDEFKYFVGDGIPKMLQRAIGKEIETETFEKIKNEFLQYYAEHCADETCAYEGIVGLLMFLKSKGVKLAVVTNKAQEMAEKVVDEVFGFVLKFDYILGMQPGIPAKPDPTGVLMAMDKLGVKPNECVFVGDTGMDVAAGVNAGAYAVGVLWGYREKDELEKSGAVAFAKEPKEIANIVMGE
ncbi:MAG: HAD-IA family hydrolase [Clostridia bacterium]|nr:HAD-IA family hydrolase [Clostridia bacterium]